MPTQLKNLALSAQKAVDLASAAVEQCIIVATAIEQFYRAKPGGVGGGLGGWGWKISWVDRLDLDRIAKGKTTLAAVVLQHEEKDPTRARVWELWGKTDVVHLYLSRTARWATRIVKMDLWDVARDTAWNQEGKRRRGVFLARDDANRMMVRLPHR